MRLGAEHRRLIAAVTLRAVLTAAVLVALYYIVPIGERMRLSAGVRLLVATVVFVAIVVWQIRTILDSPNPAFRAVQVLALAVPLFLILFAAIYFELSVEASANFSQESLTRTDALYLSITIFSTVGFGDITPTSQVARAVVSAQMILDLLIIGFGINALFSLARFGRQRQESMDETGTVP